MGRFIPGWKHFLSCALAIVLLLIAAAVMIANEEYFGAIMMGTGAGLVAILLFMLIGYRQWKLQLRQDLGELADKFANIAKEGDE